MKQTKRNVIGMAGVISTVLGMTVTIASLGEGNYWLSIIAGLFIVCGLLLVALALGD
ncbi:MAG: hypothetical protein AABX19_00135 [Nanoarchaeota archaeon]